MKKRQHIKQSRRWIIKIGSALLTQDGTGLNRADIAEWVNQIAQLKQQNVEVVLVSSGAVAEGMCRLGWTIRPRELHHLQAAAAVGQMGLVQAYESEFSRYDMHTAQVLLTHEDLSNRGRYLNARSTIRSLLQLGVIPVINENDTVVTDEIRFGDNDTLAALAANLVEADYLIILTDQEGLYDKDPRKHTDARFVSEALVSDTALDAMSEGGSGVLGRGGMVTKIRAARLAARSGTSTVIAHGKDHNILLRIRSGDDVGTLLTSEQASIAARKQWLAGHLKVRGQLKLDEGAVRVLTKSGRSLLGVGVTDVMGDFVRGEMVACLDSQGREVARGLVNYKADEVRLIMGEPSERIEELLGYIDEPELIHRDNMVLV